MDESEQRSGDLAWHSVGDLLNCLESLKSSTARSTAAAGARAEYERVHQPGAFAAALHEILERRAPRQDPDANERRLITLESMTRTIVTALLPQAVPAAPPPPPSPVPAPVPAPPDPALEAMRLQIDQLREECLGWAAQVSDLREECRRWSAGSSWQGAFRRWLLRD